MKFCNAIATLLISMHATVQGYDAPRDSGLVYAKVISQNIGKHEIFKRGTGVHVNFY